MNEIQQRADLTNRRRHVNRRVPRPHRTYLSLSDDYHFLLERWSLLCGACRGVTAQDIVERHLRQLLSINQTLACEWLDYIMEQERVTQWPE